MCAHQERHKHIPCFLKCKGGATSIPAKSVHEPYCRPTQPYKTFPETRGTLELLKRAHGTQSAPQQLLPKPGPKSLHSRCGGQGPGTKARYYQLVLTKITKHPSLNSHKEWSSGSHIHSTKLWGQILKHPEENSYPWLWGSHSEVEESPRI